MKTKIKRDLRVNLAMAAAALAVGVVMSGWAAGDILTRRVEMAQATPPLQSTPGAETKPSAPGTTTGQSQGVRPAEVAPEPARPDADAQKAGTPAALPPAPAEKTAAPIQAK